ncbi:type IV secretion system protein [Lysobacter sp. cf310]|uniref:type IV secretion system protein n=1 Tax=Lysobacter sp. cf310 TaxID=1761790 RepID=UPI0008E8B25F|nr:type IV secretion system protein [Lysobacter sp. cf310]SFK98630.1 type IV secretion system protein VirB6 [Lysobacter sp. cf310]
MPAGLQWGSGFVAAWEAWSPRAAGIGEFAFFKLVNDYLSVKVDEFGLELMGRFMTWATGIALTLVTLWILIAGYRIVTGQSREPMIALVTSMTRIAVIVGVATTMSVFGGDLHQTLTGDLDREVHGMFTGNSDRSSADAIDENLAYMQVALSAIDAVQIVDGDQQMYDEKARALLFAGFGTASPPMTAGAMLLLYKFTLALFVGLGPLFILCLIFDQTKDLFRKWLMYGLGTLFSMAMLSAVTAIALELASRVAGALWMAKAINGILGTDVEGLTTQAMQQGGIGLLLTVLIITVPPAAAMFFQGTLGGFNHFSGFQAKSEATSQARAAYQPPMPAASNPDSGRTGGQTLPGLGPRTP